MQDGQSERRRAQDTRRSAPKPDRGKVLARPPPLTPLKSYQSSGKFATSFLSVWTGRLHFMLVAEDQQHKTCQNSALTRYSTASYQTEHNKRRAGGGDPETLLSLNRAKTGDKSLLITDRLITGSRVFWLFVKTRATHPNHVR